MYNKDSNASLPEGISPVDVAALVKCYLATLPEPLTTLELYNEIRGARSSIHAMRSMLKRLPTVNYTTLEFISALLLRVSQKSVLNKMDTQSLAMEMAPVIIWQKGRAPDLYQKILESTIKRSFQDETTYSAWDMLSDEGDSVDDSIPLDDVVPIDLGAIEVIQCLMEHHNANETIWR